MTSSDEQSGHLNATEESSLPNDSPISGEMEETTTAEGGNLSTGAAAADKEKAWPRKGGGVVVLEGYVSASASSGKRGHGEIARTKSLTEEDLEELKGCIDLGFAFSYAEIPELCSTLPALELCYSMSMASLLGDRHHDKSPVGSPPVSNWRISGPGDDPDEVKARLKYWAQTIACTVRLCS